MDRDVTRRVEHRIVSLERRVSDQGTRLELDPLPGIGGNSGVGVVVDGGTGLMQEVGLLDITPLEEFVLAGFRHPLRAPWEFSDLIGFYEADAISGPSHGDPLSAVTARLGLDWEQTDEDRQPEYRTNQQNGLPGVLFASGGPDDQYLEAPGWDTGFYAAGTATTQFWLINPDTTTPGGLLDGHPGNANGFRNAPAGEWEWGTAGPSVALGLPDAGPVLLEFTTEHVSGTTRRVKAWRNGVSLGTFNQASATPLSWGPLAYIGLGPAGLQFEGLWFSTAIYRAVMADADRETVRAWFRDKWGL